MLGSFRQGSERARRRTLISLTPLIDVVFILLVFFMLASSFAQWRHIALGGAQGGAAPAAAEGALLVEVRADGLRFAGLSVTREDLLARVRAHVEAVPARRILVRPGAGVSLADTVATLDALAGAGAADLALVR